MDTDGWMQMVDVDERMDELMFTNEWIDGWMDVDSWIFMDGYRWMNKECWCWWMNGRINVYEWMEGWMEVNGFG